VANLPSHDTRTVRRTITWITNTTTPLNSRVHELWVETAATPTKFKATAIDPMNKNTAA
jgi:hypothetical protein